MNPQSEPRSKMWMAAVDATILFTKLHDQSSATCGLTDEGVVVDCRKSNKRLAMAPCNDPPGHFVIGVADKNTPDNVVPTVLPLEQLTAETVFGYMDREFAKK